MQRCFSSMLALMMAARTEGFHGPAPLKHASRSLPPEMISGGLSLPRRQERPLPPLERFRRVLELRQLRQRRREQQQQQQQIETSGFMLGPEMTAQAASFDDAERDLLQRLLPVMLVLFLTVGNGLQISHVLEQVAFVDGVQRELGSQLGFDLITDIFQSEEFNGGLSNVVGQAVAEALGGPLLRSGFELFLNAALAQAFGRRLVSLLIVGEAAIDAACELAGQSAGDILGEGLQPLSEAWLVMISQCQL